MYEKVKQGKVRSVYTSDDSVVLVASDEVSAFDKKLGVKIPDKGKILTALSAFWFNWVESQHVITAFITADTDDMDIFFQAEEFEGRCTEMMKLEMLPIEAIVRGYISGSAWKNYKKGSRQICGESLPDGLRNAEKLPEPIFTPTTKAPEGMHDENIFLEEMANILSEFGLEDGMAAAIGIKNLSLFIYRRAAEYALERGIILADTKFEFGLDHEGNIRLADEVLTPDSSRFWPAKEYVVGEEPPSYDKQIIRNYISAHGGIEEVTEIPDEILQQTAEKYGQIYRILTSINGNPS